MPNEPLPPLLAKRWGHLQNIRQVTPTEWHAECPQCGEAGHDPNSGWPDRFHMHIDGSPRGKCRRCGYFSFADEMDEEPPSPTEIKRRREDAEARRRRLEREREAKLAALQEDRWYERMADMNDKARALWRAEGIPDSLQRLLVLGYTDNKPYSHLGELHHSPALSIPYFGVGRVPLNVEYRLLNPVEGAGKYRPTAGLLMPLYLTDPDRPIAGDVLLVEGAKKAIVVYLHLVLSLGETRWNVVGTPGKDLSGEQGGMLENAERIWVLLDPDAGLLPFGDSKVGQVVDNLGRERCFVVNLPFKVDDMLNDGSLNGIKLRVRLSNARKA